MNCSLISINFSYSLSIMSHASVVIRLQGFLSMAPMILPPFHTNNVEKLYSLFYNQDE